MQEVNKKCRWRNVPYTNGYYQVSEQGDVRVVSKKCRMYADGLLTDQKYEAVPVVLKRKNYKRIELLIPAVTLKTEWAVSDTAVSSLIYAAFHGLSNIAPENILHLDANEQNNDIRNLILCDRDEKINFIQKNRDNALVFQYPTQTATGFKAYSPARRSLGISEYDLEGKRLAVYLNAAHLSYVRGINIQTIRKVVSGFKFLEFNDRIFKIGFGPAHVDAHLISEKKMVITNHTASNKEKKIFRYDTLGKLNCVYNNLFEAAAFNSIDLNCIKDCMRTKLQYKDYIYLAID